MFHSQLLMPYRARVFYFHAHSKDMEGAIIERKKRVDLLKNRLKNDNVLDFSITAILNELDGASGAEQKEVEVKLKKIMRLINKRLPKLEIVKPKIKKALSAVYDWMIKRCIPLMNDSYKYVSNIQDAEYDVIKDDERPKLSKLIYYY